MCCGAMLLLLITYIYIFILTGEFKLNTWLQCYSQWYVDLQIGMILESVCVMNRTLFVKRICDAYRGGWYTESGC